MPPPKPPTPCASVDPGYDVCWKLSDDNHVSINDPVNKIRTLLDFKLSWKMNETHVNFKASANTYGWLGIGWSRDGRMEGGEAHPFTNENGTFGDLIIMFIADDKPYLFDCYAHERNARLDDQQDVKLISGSRDTKNNKERITFEFVRQKFTGDIYRDYNFTEDDMPMAMWAASDKLPSDFTLRSQQSFTAAHSAMEYYPLSATGWKRTDIFRNQMISLAGVIFVGLAFVVTITGIILGVKLKNKRGGNYSSASPTVHGNSSFASHEMIGNSAPLSPREDHHEIELSISSDTD